MSKQVIALVESPSAELRSHLKSALTENGSVVELGAVADDAQNLAREIADAEIILTSASSLMEHPELFSWLRSLRPLVDLWEISDAVDHSGEAGEKFDELVRVDQLTKQATSALTERLERRLRQKFLLRKMKIVARSARMGLIAETIDRMAKTNVSALIVGPSGSGKELLARAIHQRSDRSAKPFIALNCGAIPEGLIESELFGHEKGAFTGSVSRREGYFSQADGGTIFLDEIGEMKPDMQVKLLRALEEGVFYPLGSDKPRNVNVRSIAATNRDLDEAMALGEFRNDLYFRLSGMRIVAPSVAERPEDIVPLLAEFTKGTNISGYSAEAIEALESYHWPGNVRQMKNFVARMQAMVGDGEIGAEDVRGYIDEQGLSAETLPALSVHTRQDIAPELLYQALLQLGSEVKALREWMTSRFAAEETVAGVRDTADISNEARFASSASSASSASIEEMEARLMSETLRQMRGNRRKTAQRLGIGERTLYRKLKKYGLN